MKSRKLKRSHPEVFGDPEENLISPDLAEELFSACVLAAATRRGLPRDESIPSVHAEAVQRLYAAGYERGRKENRNRE